jgi:hypothetical protein
MLPHAIDDRLRIDDVAVAQSIASQSPS